MYEAASSAHVGLLGLTRLAVFVLDGKGLVTHWSSTAGELFGYEREDVLGRSVGDLLLLPDTQRDALEPLTGGAHAWIGHCRTSHIDGGLREVAWWVYPLADADGARLLVLAADGARLRRCGPGLAIGDRLAFAPPESPDEVSPALRIVRSDPTMASTDTVREADMLGQRLAELLPRMRPALCERIAQQVLICGYPAIDMGVRITLPLTPYWGAAVRPLRPIGASDADDRPEEDVERAAARERLIFLSETSSLIGSSLDLVQTVRELTQIVVPRFTDFAGVHLLNKIVQSGEFPARSPGGSGQMKRVAVMHNDEPGRWDDTVPIGEEMTFPPESPFAKCMETARAVLVTRVGEEFTNRIAAQFDSRDLRPLIRDRSLLIVPLAAREIVLGFVVLMRRPDRRPFDDIDVATAEELARRAALCMDNARLFLKESNTASMLQESMQPEQPPDLSGVEIAYRYLPGSDDVQVGGDWFDAIPLPGSRVGLVVGDVMGHGVHSAAVMGQFRTAVQTLANLDLPPGQLLRQLDDLAQSFGENYLATCLYAVYDPVSRKCEIANAGHVPPVLVGPDGHAELLELPAGAPIGVGGVAFEPMTCEVADGSQLVLCTDGLVEVRGQDINIGLAALCENLAKPTRSLEEACTAVLRALSSTERQDDVALLMARFEGIAPGNVRSWTLNPTPEVVGRARSLARGTLVDWGLDDLVDIVELLVSELVTNAIRYATSPVGLRMMKANGLLCEVSDDDHNLPVLCQAAETDECGRGLHLVSQLSARWGTSRTTDGKVVWFRQSLSDTFG